MEQLEARPPWEQLQGEPDHAYAWFVRYAELHDERSVEKVSRFCGVPATMVRKASVEHAWESRVASFDETVVNVVDHVNVDDAEALAMQFAVGKAMIRLGVTKMQLINPAMLKVKDALVLMQQGSEMMRRGAGVADLTIEQRTAQDRIESQFLELLGGD